MYARNFYENVYIEPSVTDLPEQDEIPGLIAKTFRGSCFDKSDKADYIMSRLGDNHEELHVLDYGASFGYLMSQLRAYGLKNLVGYEISRKRARFGMENLSEEILSTPEEVLSHPMCPFDVIIASHVLEHLVRIGDALHFFNKALRHPEGRLFIWVPNASQPALDRLHNGTWATLVGEPHQFAFDYDFFSYSLPRHGFQIAETGDPSDAEIRLLAKAV